MPDNETDFKAKLKLYFPHFYDVKYMVKDDYTLSGSLNKVATRLNVKNLSLTGY